MVRLATLAFIVLSIAAPLAGCANSASVPDSVPVGDEAAKRATFDALRENEHDKASSYVAGTGEMSDADRKELDRTLVWMRFTSSGFTGETFDNVTVMDSTAKVSYTKTTADEDGSFSFSVELDMKKEEGG